MPCPVSTWPSERTATRSARADDQHRVSRPDVGIHAYRVVGDATRFGKGGFFERELRRHCVQAAFRHPGVMRHGAVNPIPKPRRLGSRLYELRRRVYGENSSITAAVSLMTRSPSLKFFTRFPACSIVPQNSCPRIAGAILTFQLWVPCHLVQVTATNTDSFDLQQHILFPDLRH